MLGLSIVLLFLLTGSIGVVPEHDPSLDNLIQEAQRVQTQDIGAWTRYAFRRHAHREVLDEDGNPVESQQLEFRVAPGPNGFDEELLWLDGRVPTPREVSRHRKRGSFARHYHRLFGGEGGEEEEAGYSLSNILRMPSYRYAGQEIIDGIYCHRLDFAPAPEGEQSGIEGRFAESLAGSMWVTVEGFHLYRAKAAIVRPISFALSLFKIYELRFDVKSRPVSDGVWLPARIETQTQTRIFTKMIRRRTLYRYSDFVPVEEPPRNGGLQASREKPRGA